jgi:hypothetical protein
MRWIRILSAALAIGLPSWSHALIVMGGVSTGSQTVMLSEGARTSVSWTVNFTPTVGNATISSSQVVFLAGGTVLTSQSKSLSRALTTGGSYTLTESIYIPPAIARAALQLGSASVTIRRTFADSTDPGTVVGSSDLYLNTAPGDGLQVVRIDLRFSNQSRASMVPQDSLLTAVAQVRTEGNGWLDARWEIADGSGLQGAPLYRPLRSFRQYVGGGQILALESPNLPTTGSGRYLVRLSVREPQLAAEAAPLLYQIMSAGPGETLEVLSPPDGTLLRVDTQFAWQPVPGARAYVLELLPNHDESKNGIAVDSRQDRRGAAMLPSTTTEMQISTLVRQGLLSGQRYNWRVIALDVAGQPLSQSPMRSIQLP